MSESNCECRDRRAQSHASSSGIRCTRALSKQHARRGRPHRALCREHAHDVLAFGGALRGRRRTDRDSLPLALMLADAAQASNAEQRSRILQRLGDVSLFMAGFFAQSFERKLVDIDYHIAMGGRAYGTLAETCRTSARGRALGAGVCGTGAASSSDSSTR